MEKRQMIILCSIGGRDINFKSITDIKVERNFSDVGNKFSIDLVDSPQVFTYDLELYMNAGYRNIEFKYGDLGTNKLTSYKGTIWDYTNTFVGNIKKLTITGICDRYINNSRGASTYLYNIDWNSYFNKRENETQPYGAIQIANIREGLNKKYSPILYDTYRNNLIINSKPLKLTGPSGKTIDLPIPDSFFFTTNIPENPEDVDNIDQQKYPEFYSMINDPNNMYWGKLRPEKTTDEEIICNFPNLGAAHTLYKKNGEIVACLIKQDSGKKASNSEYVNNGDHLYANVKKLIEFKSDNENSVAKNWPENFNAYTQETALPQWWVGSPLKNKKEYFNDTPYINVYNKNNNLIGFRTDGDETKTDNDVFIDFTCDDALGAGQLSKGMITANLEQVQQATTSAQIVEDRTGYLYFYQNKTLRGFVTKNRSTNQYEAFYLQANPNKEGFGGAGLVKSGEGVNISWIVKQLATLEGWRYKDEYIVQTELVPNSDAFIMQGQSAFEFIQKNLIPKAVTPIGKYTDLNGKEVEVTRAQGGFGIFFDNNGDLHFQPISQTNLQDLNIDNLGYNVPNSPTISFQVNTKGTAFYNFQKTVINTTYITSGIEVERTEVLSDDESEDIRKTKGHNDTFDSWLGLKYNTVQRAIDKSELTEDCSSYGTDIQNIAIGLAQNALISSPTTKLSSSGAYNSIDVTGNIKKAIKIIEDFTVTANMNMWGDYRIKPAGVINITNMVKGGRYNNNFPEKHPSSGRYVIQSVSESISSSSYTQSLNLLRFTEDLEKLINPYNIDYSKDFYIHDKADDNKLVCKNCDDPIIESTKVPEYSVTVQGKKR